jgi:hypothetical protein
MYAHHLAVAVVVSAEMLDISTTSTRHEKSAGFHRRFFVIGA